MEQGLKAIENGEREQESPSNLVSKEIFRLDALGAAFLSLADDADLPGRFRDIVEMMVEQTGIIEDKLGNWEPAP